ncbi:YhdT family protein [Mannheimia indoligenes]|uniref:YhdT family protein n=1 Tax=Mannheimia indoligenes TaxID=3103145 RepID=UPI002FE66F9E
MYQQLAREARWAILLTLLYILGWIGFAYFSPQGRGIFGFPIWFELSCIFLPIIFTLIAIIVIKKIYKNIDFEVHNE